MGCLPRPRSRRFRMDYLGQPCRYRRSYLSPLGHRSLVLSRPRRHCEVLAPRLRFSRQPPRRCRTSHPCAVGTQQRLSVTGLTQAAPLTTCVLARIALTLDGPGHPAKRTAVVDFHVLPRAQCSWPAFLLGGRDLDASTGLGLILGPDFFTLQSLHSKVHPCTCRFLTAGFRPPSCSLVAALGI